MQPQKTEHCTMLSVQTTKLPRHQAGRLQLLLQKQQQEHVRIPLFFVEREALHGLGFFHDLPEDFSGVIVDDQLILLPDRDRRYVHGFQNGIDLGNPVFDLPLGQARALQIMNCDAWRSQKGTDRGEGIAVHRAILLS